jgi:starch synthase
MSQTVNDEQTNDTIRYNILFVSSELHPFAKTGGLGDVSSSLPKALKTLHQDIRILIPAYPFAVQKAEQLENIGTVSVAPLPIVGTSANIEKVSILETKLPGSNVKVWMVECAALYNRSGGPYQDEQGNDWYDNATRFALLNHVAVEIAMGRTRLNWQPDIVHCNDWQTGLVAALLNREKAKIADTADEIKPTVPASIFTIHNMAHMGVFSRNDFEQLNLDFSLWNQHELEFHGQFSFIKAGLTFSDRINAVSPTYAQEIQTEEFGYGLAGLLKHRQHRLSGILNGIDMNEWDPAKDPHISANYSINDLNNKQQNKSALLKHFNLPPKKNTLLLGMVARLVYQKGLDLLLDSMQELLNLPVQIAILGSGDKHIENQLRHWAEQYPGQIQLVIGYDEALSHQIEAGADAFLMPSRFEPCGLNQLYSLRYGTIPIVNKTGGLADTVVHACKNNFIYNQATGIVFHEQEGSTLLDAVKLTCLLYQDKALWKQLMINGMKQEFSWKQSARQYMALYTQALKDRDKG